MRIRTREEYEATALLMGAIYSPRYHVYYWLGAMTYLDADTLEQMTRKEVTER